MGLQSARMSVTPLSSRAGVDPAGWLQEHGDYLFAYALLRVRRREVAEDLVQETLLAGMQRFDTFQARSSVRTWLVGILKHKIVDHFRKDRGIAAGISAGVAAGEMAGSATRARHAAAEPSEQAGEDGLRDWLERQFNRRGKWIKPPQRWPRSRADLPRLTPAELEELRDVLADCLDRLPPRACEALLLSERSVMPAENVGKVLQASATNIGVLLHRARTALRQCLEVHWFGRKGR
jgi:RNA polymerase sigma-70 factor, ECF subfamily